MSKSNSKVVVAEIKTAYAQHIGYGQQRKTLEDRCLATEVPTPGGLELTVGIVADGIGGANAGEAAGQLVLDSVLNYLRNSQETDINTLLEKAVQAAHIAVRNAAKANIQLRSMGTTATVAAVCNGKLYIAHIGDSRAYLVREGNLVQLTMDHTWGNEKVREGLITLEQAHNHPRKEELARYVGQPTAINVFVDVGLRLDNETDPARSQLTHGGLSLQPGDVFVLCTDGLIKERRDGIGHFVEDNEIVNVVGRNDPEDAANTLVSLALGRQVDDNVSVVIMEAAGKKKPLFAWPFKSNKSLILTAVVAGLIGVILFGIIVFAPPREPTETPASPIPTTQLAAADQDATPIPLGPDLSMGFAKVVDVQGEVKYETPTEAPEPAEAGETIMAAGGTRIFTAAGSQVTLQLSDDSTVFLGENTSIVLTSIADTPGGLTTLTQVKGYLLVDSDNLLVLTNQHAFQAQATGTLMGMHYEPINGYFMVDCLEGTCLVGDSLQLTSGQRAGYEEGRLMDKAVGAVYDPWIDLGGEVVPTPAVTPTMTASPIPTETLMPTATPVPPDLPGGPPGQPGGGDDDDDDRPNR